MRIGILQLNAKLSNPEHNGQAIEQAYRTAIAKGAELVLSPEMAVPGYLSEDRLWESDLRQRITLESHRLANVTGEIPLLLGTCSPEPSGRLWNELWWCQSGTVHGVARKRVLAAYDVFDETRYFEPGREMPPLVHFKGEQIGLTICEDLWADGELNAGPIRYGVHPVADLIASGATLILNASASPGHLGSYLPPGKSPEWAVPSKLAMRQRLLQGYARRYGLPIAYASRVGAESWLLFDGGSGLVRPDGTWTGATCFEETVLVVDTHTQGQHWEVEDDEAPWLRQALCAALRDNMAKQGLEAAVVGMSGGLDSAVVVALAAEVLGPDKVLGVALPTRFTSQESLDLAAQQASVLGISFLQCNTDLPYEGFSKALSATLPGRGFGLTDENLQSRARGALLMGLTSEPSIHEKLGTQRVVVLNTGNKSEAATGYFTLYGDGIGAFGVLGDCLKQRVFSLARHLGDRVPKGVIDRKPTAELAPGQTDEASLLPYRLLDAILGIHVETRRSVVSLERDLAEVLDEVSLKEALSHLPRVLRLLKNAEFKRRQLPFAIKVTPRAFGMGRRMPLTGL